MPPSFAEGKGVGVNKLLRLKHSAFGVDITIKCDSNMIFKITELLRDGRIHQDEEECKARVWFDGNTVIWTCGQGNIQAGIAEHV